MNVVDTDKLLQKLKKRQDDQNPVRVHENRIGTLMFREEECLGRISRLYEDLSGGVIDQEDYRELRNQYQEERLKLKSEMEVCRTKLEQVKSRIRSFEELAEMMNQYISEFTLTRELADLLIDRIYVENGKIIEIRFNCRDIFQDVLQILKEGEQK